ncbi:hypothetical protein NSU18_04385 [Paenibacillus sp. FSL H8-0048]|uniref:hypothetical protein n=1 Tax=Paenibacillus sp. FSL H8-0048 TaxID=2954508 RepID=UPI0030F839D3
MKQRIQEVIECKFRKSHRARRRFKLAELEKAIIESFEYPGDYNEADGRSALKYGIEALVADGYLIPIIKKVKFSSTDLEEAYWLTVPASSQAKWSETAMMRVIGAKGLNLDYYRNHPEAQTAHTWDYIERIYEFLLTAEDRKLITREERSLELFDQEKYLAGPEGKQLLSRKGMNLELLRAEIVREDFGSFRMPGRPVDRILISENLSFYHSAKNLIQNGLTVCGMHPDMLIYGKGWKVVSSLHFLEEQGIDPLEPALFYVGDMDKKGWEIYGKLKLDYPELNMKLALPVYLSMHSNANRRYDYVKEQTDCPPPYLERVRQEFSAIPELLLCMNTLLTENKRIPQEVLNYEVMARLARA